MFRITAALRSVCDITPTMLQHFGIRGLLLDLDNTLTTHDNPRPAEGVLDWIAVMKENGIAMCIVSNNHPPRVKPFADLLGLPFVCEGKKPLSKGFPGGKSRYGTSLERTGGCWRPDFYGCAGGKPQTVEMYFCLSDCTRANPVFPVQTANGSTIPSP